MQNSSSITDEATQQSGVRHVWDTPGWLTDKPANADYGYVARGEAVPCSSAELSASFIARGPTDLWLVWTPETPNPVLPERVPLLVSAFKKISVKGANQSIYWGLGFFAFGLVVALLWGDGNLLYRSFLSLLGALLIVEGIWQRVRARHYTQEDAEADASSLRFDAWIKTKKIRGYTFVLAVLIVVVGSLQAIADPMESIARAGLVKQAVWDGQWWRLFTACLMHVNFMHFWMNFLALLYFARIVEQTMRRAYIPLVFLAAGVCGSVFSLLLYPHATSVGASGGLMGLLGFISVGAYLNKDTYPPKYLRKSLEAIVMVGVFGIIGFALIDNAAHLGGLCGGLLFGWWLLRPYNQKSDEAKVGRQVATLGTVALVILGLAALMAIYKIMWA